MSTLSAADFGLPPAERCPFCQGLDTELHTGFGAQLSLAGYWCRRCRTPFDVFRPAGALLAQGGIAEAEIRKKVAEAET